MFRDYFTQDVFTVILLVNLIFIVSAKLLFSNRFIDFLEVNWNVRYLKLYAKERKNSDFFNVLLFLNLVLGLSAFIHIVYSYFVIPLPDNALTFIKLFAIVGVIITFKIAVETMVARLFEISEMIKIYLFQKLAHLHFSGLVLLIINFFLLFSFIDKKLIIYTGFCLLLLINLIGFIRFLRLYQKIIIPNLFYFLLYLCALEIGPYVILYKAIKDYFG